MRFPGIRRERSHACFSHTRAGSHRKSETGALWNDDFLHPGVFRRSRAASEQAHGFSVFLPAEAQPWLSLKIPRDNQILESFASLKEEFDADLPGAEEVLRAMLRILFVRVNRVYSMARPQATPTRADTLARAFHLAVEKHFREFQNLPEYAKLLDVSENHLNDVVREQTGSSAGEIIRRRRLPDAKRLLSHLGPDGVGNRISIGFKDPSYFSRFFTRLTSESPAAFRDQIREKYQGKPG